MCTGQNVCSTVLDTLVFPQPGTGSCLSGSGQTLSQALEPWPSQGLKTGHFERIRHSKAAAHGLRGLCFVTVPSQPEPMNQDSCSGAFSGQDEESPEAFVGSPKIAAYVISFALNYQSHKESLLLFLALHLIVLHPSFDSSPLQFCCIFLGHCVRKTNSAIKSNPYCLLTEPA